MCSDPDLSEERIANCDSENLTPLGNWVRLLAIYAPKAILYRKLGGSPDDLEPAVRTQYDSPVRQSKPSGAMSRGSSAKKGKKGKRPPAAAAAF